MVRGKHTGVGGIFQGSGSCGDSIWVRYMGDYPLHGPVPGGVPSQGRPEDHSKTAATASGR